jgi:hypothetical protein
MHKASAASASSSVLTTGSINQLTLGLNRNQDA